MLAAGNERTANDSSWAAQLMSAFAAGHLTLNLNVPSGWTPSAGFRTTNLGLQIWREVLVAEYYSCTKDTPGMQQDAEAPCIAVNVKGTDKDLSASRQAESLPEYSCHVHNTEAAE